MQMEVFLDAILALIKIISTIISCDVVGIAAKNLCSFDSPFFGPGVAVVLQCKSQNRLRSPQETGSMPAQAVAISPIRKQNSDLTRACSAFGGGCDDAPCRRNI
jgi:hypothetical protein